MKRIWVLAVCLGLSTHTLAQVSEDAVPPENPPPPVAAEATREPRSPSPAKAQLRRIPASRPTQSADERDSPALVKELSPEPAVDPSLSQPSQLPEVARPTVDIIGAALSLSCLRARRESHSVRTPVRIVYFVAPPYDEARSIREEHGGYLLAYRHQFLIVDRYFIETLGLDPDDPDWADIRRDWIRPANPAARARLYGKLLARTREP